MSVIRNGKERERDTDIRKTNTRMDSTLTESHSGDPGTSHAERSPLNCFAYKTLMMERTSREEEEEKRRV